MATAQPNISDTLQPAAHTGRSALKTGAEVLALILGPCLLLIVDKLAGSVAPFDHSLDRLLVCLNLPAFDRIYGTISELILTHTIWILPALLLARWSRPSLALGLTAAWVIFSIHQFITLKELPVIREIKSEYPDPGIDPWIFIRKSLAMAPLFGAGTHAVLEDDSG